MHCNANKLENTNLVNSTGFVRGAGNSAVTRWYQFPDTPLVTTNTWYRLRLIDLDEHFTWSNYVLLQRKMRENTLYVTNPFRDRIDMRFA
jgi:hypothetical protein